MAIDAKKIRELREKTGAPMQKALKVFNEQKGDMKKAEEILKKAGFEKAAKRAERETGQGYVASYSHHNHKLVAIVELLCETDFVAKNEMFQSVANDLAMQVASMGAEKDDELLKQDFIKDPRKKVEDLVKDVIAKTGENIRMGRIVRVEVGK